MITSISEDGNDTGRQNAAWAIRFRSDHASPFPKTTRDRPRIDRDGAQGYRKRFLENLTPNPVGTVLPGANTISAYFLFATICSAPCTFAVFPDSDGVRCPPCTHTNVQLYTRVGCVHGPSWSRRTCRNT